MSRKTFRSMVHGPILSIDAVKKSFPVLVATGAGEKIPLKERKPNGAAKLEFMKTYIAHIEIGISPVINYVTVHRYISPGVCSLVKRYPIYIYIYIYT